MEVSSSRGVRTPIIACRGLRAAQTRITADPTMTPVAISLDRPPGPAQLVRSPRGHRRLGPSGAVLG
jgi:hypothetical protein